MAPIERITLFKIPNEADLARVLEQYKVLAKTATKVSNYCLFCTFHNPQSYSCAVRVVQLRTSMYYLAIRKRAEGEMTGIVGMKRNAIERLLTGVFVFLF